MIPLHLSISGFLSYRDPVEIDLSRVNLACIAGPNGAGKSSLLDAFTWALFGQARRRDDSVINAHSNASEVGLTFEYEGNIYRVQRSKTRDKAAMLEFHILQNPEDWNGRGEGGERLVWKSLNERTLRETEKCIEATLRLGYETFVNASFFLQGKADQFTQQRPGDRKRILSSILGLEVWETYRQRASDQRKDVEGKIISIDGRLAEIQGELAEEEIRVQRLAQVEGDLARLSQLRSLQENALDGMRKAASALEEQRRMVETLARQLTAAQGRLAEMEEKIAGREQERSGYSNLLARAQQIEEAYAGWQAARAGLERWEEIAAQFREHEKRRQAPLDEINAEQTRLTEQLKVLHEQQAAIEKAAGEVPGFEDEIKNIQNDLQQAEALLKQRRELELDLNGAHQRQAEARAENPRLKAEMDELKERIDRLSAAEGAECPLCGQPLSPTERQELIEDLAVQGKEKGDQYRANLSVLREADKVVLGLETQIKALAPADGAVRAQARKLDQLTDRLANSRLILADWESQDKPRLLDLERMLKEGDFAQEARRVLAVVDAELKDIGYDAAEHDAVRKAEVEGRAAEAELRALEQARAALAPLEREITDLNAQLAVQREETLRQQDEHERSAATLREAEASAPDVYSAERELLTLQEQENRLHMEVGAARQKVQVLDSLKERRKAFTAEREECARKVGQYKQLERAFSKDGVPALLIEQALPQIEAKSNELLERLSGGNMSVRFVTQAAYKDKRRDDFRETLEIQISDGSGTRDYEMFSGGEAFRVNFAVRLALSEVLAQRAGARLQTLVIDEGFGSQDLQGRQRLIEAINMVRADFAKILVITHIDELKDAFPFRIEVEKTPRGSTLTVI